MHFSQYILVPGNIGYGQKKGGSIGGNLKKWFSRDWLNAEMADGSPP
jgi:hypothetical protein